VNNNPMFEFHPNKYTNNPLVISQNEKMVAVNSALQVDITGQVCADSIGTSFYSGIGGQVDFIRGAFAFQRRKTDHRDAGHGQGRHDFAYCADPRSGGRRRYFTR
jgi:acyl-CoA hydrolase